MTQEEKMKLLQGMFQGANMQNAQINVVVESGATVVYKQVAATKSEVPQVTDEQIVNAIEKNEIMFWGQSAWAVFYCVCRDHLNIMRNMTETEQYINGLPFTRQLTYGCPTGTIQSTLKNNPYMKLPISKWKTNGGKERAVLLAEKLIEELDEK